MNTLKWDKLSESDKDLVLNVLRKYFRPGVSTLWPALQDIFLPLEKDSALVGMQKTNVSDDLGQAIRNLIA